MKSGPKAEIVAAPLDLSGLPASGPRRVDAFAREYLTVPRGKGARTRFRLRPWQKQIVGRLFPARGARPRQGVVSMPRGNGKTSLGAVLATYALFADNVEGAEVLLVASRCPAGRYHAAAGVPHDRPGAATGRTGAAVREPDLPAAHGFVADRPTGRAGSVAGLESVAGDRRRAARGDEAGVGCGQSLAAGKREKSLTLAISTPGADRDGIMWSLVEHGRRGDDPSFVLVEYAAPDDCEVDDEDAWKIGNPALDDFLFRDALRSTRRTTREADFRRFRLGQWTQHAEAWLTREQWAACLDPRPIPDGAEVVLGFDGSYRGDATVVVVVEVGAVPHCDVVQVWQAPEGRLDYQVPIVAVEDTIRAACRRWKVQEIVADPFRWARSLQILEGDGLPVVEYPQSPARMTPATQRFGEAVLNQTLTHSGHPDLTRHVLNATVKADSRGVRLSKEHRDSARKIDCAVAAVMAYARARTWRRNHITTCSKASGEPRHVA